MAIGFNNNLLYFFVFFLISIALSGMWLTNKNVENFEMTEASSNSLFANEDNQIQIQYRNLNSKSFLWDIEISADDKFDHNKTHKIEEIVSGKILKRTFVNWRPLHRGLYPSPRLLIQSRFPFGMLRAWKYFDQKTEFIVYPEKKGTKDLPQAENTKAQEDLKSVDNTKGLFRDHREFQKTDSPNKIDWKLSLKHQRHFVKNFESGDEKKVLIDWKMTNSNLNFEDRISQLALWIDLYHKKNEPYSLKINNDQTEYSSLSSHYKKCMEKLALLKIEDTL